MFFAVALLSSGCDDICDGVTCNANQEPVVHPITNTCECQCKGVFVDPECTVTRNEFDIDLIKSYLVENEIEAVSEASGLHYVITESAGSEERPDINNEVDITYKGYLLDGTVFDSGNIDISLQNVIAGWQEGIPFFAKGDKGMLFIPSELAYGLNPPFGSPIPANAVLIFDVELHGFQ